MATHGKNIKREKDIKGHLLSDKEKKNQKDQSINKTNKIELWWAEGNDSSKTKLSPKDKLLKEDFQILQAYNYLRAWKSMQGTSVTQ